MATKPSTSAEELASAFATRIGHMSAKNLYFSDDGDQVHIWLETDLISPEEESEFYGALASLYDEYEAAYIRLHIINPRTFPDANHRLSGIAPDARSITIPSR